LGARQEEDIVGKLEGRVALVTGAASGLGRASALLFAAEGAAVVFADIDAAGAAAAADEAATAGERTLAHGLDVTSYAGCQEAVSAILDRFGRLDVLLTCAGIGDSGRITDLDAETFGRVLNVNVTGTFLCAKAAWEALGAQGGSIIALGSVAGVIGAPGFSSYGASKAAVIHLMKILAAEGASRKIRANSICPSWVWTPMVARAVQRLMPGAPDEIAQQYFARQAPLGRMGLPEDVAKAALFLASDDSAYMTGQALILDGGITIGPRAL
jgi:NAD(P)-dependent dehydrogenase (short-subunit alcohol dehydrogenase family)